MTSLERVRNTVAGLPNFPSASRIARIDADLLGIGNCSTSPVIEFRSSQSYAANHRRGTPPEPSMASRSRGRLAAGTLRK